MAKLFIVTQVHENYGGHPVNAPHWKPKGGNSYVVNDIDPNLCLEIVDELRPLIEVGDDYFSEVIINWEVLSDYEMSEMENEWIVSQYTEWARVPAMSYTLRPFATELKLSGV